MQGPSQTSDTPMRCQTILTDRQGMIYAGFWPRFIAKILDWIICGLLISVFPIPQFYDDNVIIVSTHLNVVFFFIVKWCIPALYTVIFLVNYNATPGKMIFSLQVISGQQKQLSYGTALARYLMEIISAFIFFMGYIISIFDSQKRTLHDRICNTYVIMPVRMVCDTVDSSEHAKTSGLDFIDNKQISNNVYGLHKVLFSMLVLESLFSIAICVTDDYFFRTINLILNCLIVSILFFALFKQRDSTISIPVKRLTWLVMFYFYFFTPVIYFMAIIIGFEQILHELPVIVNDPILFFMQAILIFMNVFFLTSFSKLIFSIIFIPCSFVLGILGIILISSTSNSCSRNETL